MLWPQNFKKYDLLCWEEGDFFLGGGLVFCIRGELRLGRRRRNTGGESQQSGHLVTFTDGFTDRIISSVIPLAILTVNRARHCTKISLWIPRWFRRHVKRWIGHITVRICRFESFGNSVGKITRKNLHVNEPPFFLILHISSVIPLVNTDRMCPSVYTSGMTNVKYSVGIKRIFGSVRVLSACGQLDCLEFGQWIHWNYIIVTKHNESVWS